MDFCCPAQRLAIELDGGQHAARTEADEKRSEFLRAQGYRVLRFWDDEVLKNPDSVLMKIFGSHWAEGESTLTLTLSRGRAGEGTSVGAPGMKLAGEKITNESSPRHPRASKAVSVGTMRRWTNRHRAD